VRLASYGDHNLLDLSAADLQRLRGAHLSMVFQDPMSALNPVMRVGAQIEEAVGAHEKLSGRARRTRAIELMERVGIPVPERRMRDYPHQFSGGMRQRVLIAMAIAGRPKLLLADEPTTALDVLIQDQILSLLLELQRDFGMSMILVSHDLGVIGEMCDRVAVMYAGEIVELADTATLLEEPRHPYTISLLRSLPDVNSQSRYLRSIGGAPPALVDVPPGCRFAPRCPLALDQCREWETELLQAGAGAHTARCWRHEETRREDAWPEQSYGSA
jgi:oligopeptide/dipeptide ABC transporter ATP-binding protein